MNEILTVYEDADKVVVTEQDDIAVVTIIAQGPQLVPGSSIPLTHYRYVTVQSNGTTWDVVASN